MWKAGEEYLKRHGRGPLGAGPNAANLPWCRQQGGMGMPGALGRTVEATEGCWRCQGFAGAAITSTAALSDAKRSPFSEETPKTFAKTSAETALDRTLSAKFCENFTKITDFSNLFFAKILRLQRCKSMQIW